MGKRGKLPKNSLPIAETCASGPTKEEKRRWAAEDGLRTLNRAEEIRGNKQLMGDIKSLATEQMNNLKRFVK